MTRSFTMAKDAQCCNIAHVTGIPNKRIEKFPGPYAFKLWHHSLVTYLYYSHMVRLIRNEMTNRKSNQFLESSIENGLNYRMNYKVQYKFILMIYYIKSNYLVFNKTSDECLGIVRLILHHLPVMFCYVVVEHLFAVKYFTIVVHVKFTDKSKLNTNKKQIISYTHV